MKKHETILVIDFGSQYNQLIARKVRDQGVLAIVKPNTISKAEIEELEPKGIILAGGLHSVYGDEAFGYEDSIFEMGVPVLGIGYGAQLMAHALGGKVSKVPTSAQGLTAVDVDVENSELLKGVASQTEMWMNYKDCIVDVPEGFTLTASTPECPIAAMEDSERRLYGIQFHPEVTRSDDASKLFENFVMKICGCQGDWQVDTFVEETVEALKEKVGDGKVLCGLSGGVDSSVAAVLLSKAVGKQLTCVFVDHGLLRKNEAEEVEAVFGSEGEYDLNFIKVDARQRFYDKLAGVTEPERKRKIIGEEFIRVFEEEAKKIGKVDFLVQGTIYADVVESGEGKKATIKSHHNVGGLPEYVDFKEIIEPLRDLFKDEVRAVGTELGLPGYLVQRQPFPGPGLAVRIIGEVTEDKVKIVQDADYIYREEVDKAGISRDIAQYFAALTNMRSVGVRDDRRTYDYAIALRAVKTSDFMTADAAQLPWEVLSKVTERIVREVDHVNRVLYDCTSKPPGTIEFE